MHAPCLPLPSLPSLLPAVPPRRSRTLVALIKDHRALEAGPPQPVHHLLQARATTRARDKGGVGAAWVAGGGRRDERW